ncbi:MAG: tetratricopeptide repeat protein, partial [Gallionella sp.]
MKPGKNDPCSCGSGKKYKHCCAKKVAAGSAAPSPADLNQLIALHNTKRFAELETKALALVNRYPNAGPGSNIGLTWKLLGVALRRQGKNALEAFLKTVALLPADAEAHANLGAIQNELGAFDQAITSFKKALSIKPDAAATLNNLGTALRFSGKLDEALIVYRHALQADPNSAHIHFNLGTTLKELGQPDQALASYRKVIALKPDSAEAYCNLCSILQMLGQLDAALESGRQAVKLNPGLAEAHSNLGYVLKEADQHDAAMECFQQAITANPNYAKVHGNIAGLYQKLGQMDEAILSFRRSLEMEPDLSTYSDLLFILNYSPSCTPSEYFSEAQKFGQSARDKVTHQFTTWESEPAPKRLRVGLVSGDLRDHPVGYFLEHLLTQLDHTCIELIAYVTQTKEDDVTQRMKTSFSEWKSIVGKSDEDAARLIHDDGIHVLVDLAGHTAYSRLPIFAWKPAPIQVAWLGYFASTGLTEMDYLIADHIGVPEVNR